ncbi:alanine racemase [Sphingomonas naphthae]|uniref:Alanine racemase n=1 Tax=Sphingomonas naphthae TaxID=1813468 RepID=A0ABY7TJT0_9SPHN|nr:alanine racemase [Sphingomonas naphthae]WCT73477.1 alanine racemase [Sphingomonas naphthae]
MAAAQILIPDIADGAGARLTIDLDALVANYRILAAQVAPARVAAVVKADAYGLGAAIVAPALWRAGARDFFVAHLGEAALLAPVLPPPSRLHILNGLMPGAEAACVALGAIPVLNSLDQVEGWARAARRIGRSLPAVMQIDSGMSRLGLPPADAETLAADPARLAGIDVTLVMSHLACGDEPASPANAAQGAAFARLAALFPGVPRSLANSGGAFLPGLGKYDLVRPGIALYGGAPQEGLANPMWPVVALEARIVQVRDVPPGVGVGYGLTSVADHPRRIATIGVGYADGWPRRLGGRGSAFIAGQRVPIAGRVSMDSMTLDVTDVPPAALGYGAPVELIGPHQTIDDVARDAETIAYEILTQLGTRYARDYLPVKGG